MPSTGISSRTRRARTRGTRFSSVQADGRGRRGTSASIPMTSAGATARASPDWLGWPPLASWPTSLSSSESAGDVDSSDAEERTRGASPSRPRIGCRMALRRPYSAAAAATSSERHPPGHVDPNVASQWVGRHHYDPAVEQRQALHCTEGVHRLVVEMIDKGRCREQDLGPQAIGCERNFQTLARSVGRRRLGLSSGRASSRLSNARCRGGRLRLDDGVQRRGEGGAFGRVVQHVQRGPGFVGGY